MDLHDRKIRQTDYRLPAQVNRWGCYFMSLLGIAQTVCDAILTVDQIKRLYDISVEGGFMRNDCTVKRRGAYGAIAEIAANTLLFSRTSIRQVGGLWYSSGKTRWWGPKDVTHTIVKGKTISGMMHYREGDSIGNIVYDPRPSVQIKEEIVELFYKVEIN